VTRAVVVGAGPAGLAAAEILGAAGVRVTIVDRMPSPARKFLMAGKSGLNITKNESAAHMAKAMRAPWMLPMLEAFDSAAVRAWCHDLGQNTFVGSSGRVFPDTMKASPLLRAWLGRLEGYGVELRRRWTWTGFQGDELTFETPDGLRQISADITMLACGGASWPRLGSDGAWRAHLPSTDLHPANMGFVVPWSKHMAPNFGQPVKGIALKGADWTRGEIVVSKHGIEGGGIYAVSRDVRDGAALMIDLKPDLSLEAVRQRLSKPRGKATMKNHLRKTLGLSATQIALLQEFARPFPDDLAPVIKALRVSHTGPMPLRDAISTAGGVSLESLTSDLMLVDRPQTYCVGEMLDWEAPTGGYLINTCLATGRWAAKAALAQV